MCGIFAIIEQSITSGFYSNHKNKILDCFTLGRSRGPEHSVLTPVHDQVLFGFHRLAINGLDDISNQPLVYNGIYLICNGEIYNYKKIYSELNVSPTTNSDCEAIIHLYQKYGIEYTLQNLDGDFGFVLYDSNTKQAYIACDPFGVRPLYYGMSNGNIVVASLLKQISGLSDTCYLLKSGSYMKVSLDSNDSQLSAPLSYTHFNYIHNSYDTITTYNNPDNLSYYYNMIYATLLESVKKRVVTMDRNLACLLSGGLDSSLITAMVSKFVPKGKLHTYSIGMSGGSDLKYARKVSDHIQSNHTEVILTEDEFFSSIPSVIYAIESYDTTSVRASVGNYLVAKYISEHSDAKVIFNGDGSDELTGGYLYFHKCPSDIEFDFECKRLITNLQYFDVLRSDRCISCHGLEPRTPFLDRTFVHKYLSIPSSLRNHNNNKRMEKSLLRTSIQVNDPDLLPHEVLWRTKEAFSDGVSSTEKSWYAIIQDKLNTMYNDTEFSEKSKMYTVNPPTTKEQLYYREIFESHFSGQGHIIPGYWMPKYCKATDASARTLDLYNSLSHQPSNNVSSK
jgi:asparagine synthase (glutamine-hydrolysing)